MYAECLLQVDLEKIAYELIDLLVVAGMDDGSFDDGRTFWRKMREHVRRLLALIPEDLDLADCVVTKRSALRWLRTQLHHIVERYKLDSEDEDERRSLSQ